MHLALGALVVSTVALPAVARFDVYRCTVMQTTHLASCCGAHAVSKTDQVRPDQHCCDFDEGADAPSGATSSASVVAGPASTWTMPTSLEAPPSRVLAWSGVRSRAPPDTPLWLRHSSLLL